MTIAEFSVKRPVAILVLMIAAAVLGVFGYMQLKVNLLPEIVYPTIRGNIAWRGASPEEIEDNIAEILEPKMATVDNLDYFTSTCMEGTYSIQINFNYTANIDAAYQDVLSKITLIRRKLPKDVDEPIILKMDPSQMPIIQMMVSSENMNLVKLRLWSENFLQKQFTTVPGTAGVDVGGGRIREIRVKINPEKLLLLGITLDKISQRLSQENIELNAGRVTTDRKEFLVRTKGRFDNISQIENLIIVPDKTGRNIYLKDIASVEDTFDTQRIITKFNGKECVKMSLYKQQDANTIEVEEAFKKKLEELKDAIPKDVKIGISYNQAEYIRSANAGVRDAALLAAFLIVLVVWFFLANWHRIFIVVIAMPLSILMTFFVMKLFGFSLNIFSLGGLVLAITIVLDDAVVVVENITRLQEAKNPNAVVLGTNEVGPALTYVTLTFMVLFLPFLLVSGLISLLFRELIIIIAIAIGSSRIVSLTVTPMLSNLLTRGIHENKSESKIGMRIMDWIGIKYKKTLQFALRKKGLIIGITFVLFLLGVWFFMALNKTFLPTPDDGIISVQVKAPIGTAVGETQKIMDDLEKIVKDLPNIDNYFVTTGGNVFSAMTYETSHTGSMDILLVPRAKRNITTDDYVSKYAQEIQNGINYPGASIRVSHRKMRGIRWGNDNDVAIELRAPKTASMQELTEKAAEIVSKTKGIKGFTGVDMSVDITKPEYQLVMNRQLLADLGLSMDYAAGSLKSFIDGTVVTSFKDQGFFYDIRVVVDNKNFKNMNDVRNLPILTFKGTPLYVRDVASVEQKVGPLKVERIDQMRVIWITGNVMGRSVGEVNKEIEQRLQGLEIQPGWAIEYGGLAKMMSENFKSLALILVLALFLAYVILAIQFESFMWPFIILLRVPLSLVGISLALFVTNTPVGITVVIGFIILAGIEIVHGVVLLTFIQQLMEQGMVLKEAVVKGAMLRLRPIIMTMSVGVFGLLPLALGIGEGTEMLKPMAIGVIGGLIFSMFLTFYFIPVIFVMVNERKRAI